MRQMFRSPRVQYLIYQVFDLLFYEVICLSLFLSGDPGLTKAYSTVKLYLLLALLLVFTVIGWLQKKGRWYKPKPKSGPGIAVSVLLLLFNWYGMAKTDFFTGRLWLHLVTFTLPVVLVYAWNYRKNFLVPEA